RRGLVDADVGRLGGKNDGNQQFKRRVVAQLGRRLGVGRPQALENLRANCLVHARSARFARARASAAAMVARLSAVSARLLRRLPRLCKCWRRWRAWWLARAAAARSVSSALAGGHTGWPLPALASGMSMQSTGH